MRNNDFIPLVDEGCAIGTGRIEGIDVAYRGMLPAERHIMITADHRTLLYRERRALYISALEASLSGFGVITLAICGGLYSVIKGVEDGGGKLFAVSVESLRAFEELRRDRIRRILLTGGGVIAPGEGGSEREKALEIALSLSSAVITTGMCETMRRALDRGLDCAVLRSSLSRKSARDAVLEGSPAIDSFSSFLLLPRVIAYHDDGGIYRFGDERFGILRL